MIEAIFLLRAYRTTLPRFGASEPLDTTRMVAERRISSTFKDVPGGQVLGPTYDYTHRLLDFSLAAAGERAEAPIAPADATQRVVSGLSTAACCTPGKAAIRVARSSADAGDSRNDFDF